MRVEAGASAGETIAVTGSSGRLGRAVVDDLLAHDFRVVGIDRIEAHPSHRDRLTRHHRWVDASVETPEGVGSVVALSDQLQGCTALVHLAAFPSPEGRPAEMVFVNNTVATFVALEAAGQIGITRAAIASSGSAYGTAFSPEPTHPSYVPVDEDHPMTNADPYGLSKEVDERTAAMMARRYAMSVAALRFHWIASRSEQLAAIEQQQGIRDWDHELRNLWGYVDVRDAARACRLAIETAKAEPYGFVALNVVAGDSLATAPVTDLIAEHAPDIEVRSPLGSRQGAYAIDRALEVIGWSPQHSWRAPTNFLETRVASDREPGGFMDTSPTPPDDVADADWMEQNSPADPADDIDLDATPTVRVRRSTVEADEADLADQSAAVPLDDDE